MGNAGNRILAIDWADALVTADLPAEGIPRNIHSEPVKTNPRAAAVGHGGRPAYVPTFGSGRLYVISGDTHDFEAGNGPCAVVAGLDQDKVCVASWADNEVRVYGPNGGTPAKVPVGTGPFALAAAPRAARVCVACESDPAAPLSVLDLRAQRTAQVTHPARVRALAAFPDPDKPIAYAACRGERPTDAGVLLVIDMTAAHIVDQPEVGADPLAVLVAPKGDRLCVLNHGAATLSIAKLLANGRPGPFSTVPTATRPSAAAFSPDGTLLYVLSRTTGLLSAVYLDEVTGELIGRRTDIPVGAVPAAVVFGPEGTHAHITDQGTGQLVSVRVSPTSTGKISTGASSKPLSIAVTRSGDESWAFTTDQAAKRIAVSDLKQATDSGAIPVDDIPWDIAIGTGGPGPAFACVTCPTSDKLLTLRPQQDQQLWTPGKVDVKPISLAKGAEPRGLAITPDGHYALTANHGTRSVSLIDLQGGGSYTIEKGKVNCSKPCHAAVVGGDDSGKGAMLYITDDEDGGLDEAKGKISILRNTETGWEHQGAITTEQGKLTGPQGIALHPDGKRLYIANYNSGLRRPDRISVLEGKETTWRYLGGISGSDYPHGLAVSPDGKTLYVANTTLGKVAQYSLGDGAAATFKFWLTITDSNYVPASLALAKDGKYLYATDHDRGDLYGIQVPQTSEASMQKVTNAPTLTEIRGVTCQGNQTLHIVNGDKADHKLTTIALKSDDRLRAESISPSVPLSDAPFSIASRHSGPLYVTNRQAGTVTVRGSDIKTATFTHTTDSKPWDVHCTPDGRYACVTDGSTNAPAVHCLTVPDLTVTTLATEADADPTGVACSPDGLRVYAAQRGKGSISLLRRVPAPPTDLLATSDNETPRAIAVHTSDSHAYRTRKQELCTTDLSKLVDGPSLSLTSTGEANGVAVHSTGRHAYVLVKEPSGSLIQVVSLAIPGTPTKEPTTVALPGGVPSGIALHPYAPYGYVVGDNRLWMLSTVTPATPVVSFSVQTGIPGTQALALRPGNPAHLYLLAADGGQDAALHVLELPVVSAAPLERVEAKLSLRGKPWALAVHPLGGHAFVSTQDQGVHLIDLTNPARPQPAGTVTAPAGAVCFRPGNTGALHASLNKIYALGLGFPAWISQSWASGLNAPERLAVSPDGALLHVTSSGSGAVQMLDTATGQLRLTLPLGTGLGGSAPHPDPSNPHLYVADTKGSALVVADTSAHTPIDRQGAGIDVRQIVLAPSSGSAD